LPRAARAWLAGLLAPLQGSGVLTTGSPLLWPLRAMLGEALPFLALAMASLALFVLVMRYAASHFARAVQEGPAVAAPLRRPGALHAVRPFREGLVRIVVRKELLLLARDPMLVGKSLLQVLYLIPLFLLMVRRGQAVESLSAVLVLLSASIAATLAWISVSGEEAPELLRCAPVPLGRLRRLKVLGAVIPIAVLALPFLAWYASESVKTALVVAAYVAVAICSSAMVQVWGTPLGAGRDLKARRSQNLVLRLVDNVGTFGWAGACYATLLGSPWALAGIAAGCLGPAAAAIAARLRTEAL
jgi:ABC-2 type transport system permease protein